MCSAMKNIWFCSRERESCEEEVLFARRFLSLADLEMEDIDIPIATHCVPSQQGVKQPIK